MFDVDDTIVAIASPVGAALRGVVRVSGKKSLELLSKLILSNSLTTSLRPVRISTMLAMNSELGNFPIDVLVWPTTNSYTGQPVVECHALGARPILEAIVAKFVSIGARPARPGEFTLRAFLAGRLDLVQAEAVLAVIDADSERQLSGALRQLAGGLTTHLQSARNQLLDLLAEIEAGLDFVEEDLHFISQQRIHQELTGVTEVIRVARQKLEQRRLTNERPRVVLKGLPNAGKSSLLNALAGYDFAIVSPQPGTTRDWLSVPAVTDGLALELVDTAGVDAMAAGAIEANAQMIANQQANQADLQILCIDLSREILTNWELERLSQLFDRSRTLVVGTKADAMNRLTPEGFPADALCTSSRTGEGIESLRRAISLKLQTGLSDETESSHVVATTTQRCAASLGTASEAIDAAYNLVGLGMDEIMAAELRIALDAIGEVTGQVYTDDILDRIFSRFCIGK